ncbi:hypothetical protein SXCC_01628 [Gluconacetobacter sp. SXCC-1]|nr:hypothetical protein SXCC_01628 [Gluconacetobacter sp. SXCC-1]
MRYRGLHFRLGGNDHLREVTSYAPAGAVLIIGSGHVPYGRGKIHMSCIIDHEAVHELFHNSKLCFYLLMEMENLY